MEPSVGQLVVSSSPHIKSSLTIEAAMRDVLIALTPATIAAVYYFGLPAVAVIITSVVTAVISEALCQKLRNRAITIRDGSATITGLLLAFCLPPTTPLWITAVGSACAIILGKQFFGGLGHNVFNPALVGRAILLASWPAAVTTFVQPIDGITSATPMAILKELTQLESAAGSGTAGQIMAQLPSLWDMFVGNIAGSLGETSVAALLLGAAYLFYKGHIDWRIPGTYIGTVFVGTAVFAAVTGKPAQFTFYHLLGGGLILGAFFMATDWVTSPITKRGRIIFGLGCGILTVIIRLKGGYPEGVCYSILLMNCATPLIDRYTKPKIYGRQKNAQSA